MTTEIPIPTENSYRQKAEVALPNGTPDDLIPVKEAGTILPGGVQAVYYRISTGTLIKYRCPKGKAMVSRAAVLAERDQPATRPKTRSTKTSRVTDSPEKGRQSNVTIDQRNESIPASLSPFSDRTLVLATIGLSGDRIMEKPLSQHQALDRLQTNDHPREEDISLDAISTDDTLQIREKTRLQAVDEYMDLMLEGHVFPPVDLFRDGNSLVVADGSHRITAARKAGYKTIRARIHDGGRVAGLLWALKSNTDHGLRLTNADKRRKVQLALAGSPFANNMQIAAMCAVAEGTIRNYRRSIVNCDPVKRLGADGKEYSVRQSSAPSPERMEKSVFKQVTRLTEKLNHDGLQRLRASIDHIIQARMTVA